MKTKIKLLLAFSMLIIGYRGYSQCGITGGITAYNYGQGNFYFLTAIGDSQNAPLAGIWNFGDGDTANFSGLDSVNFVNHAYTRNGTYTVCVTAHVADSTCTYTTCDTVTVNLCPGLAGYGASQTGFGNYVFGPNLAPDSTSRVLWSFGDGTTSNVLRPSHHYTSGGTYNVCYYLNDTALGCLDTNCQQLSVSLCSFANSFQYDSGYYPPNTFAVLNAVPGYTYTWNFGDGAHGSGDTASHSYNHMGYYTFCLVTSDSITGCADSICQSQEIDPCNIYGGFSESVNGLLASFAASGNPANTYSYGWAFPGAIPATSIASSPTVTYGQTGTYQALLILTNQNSCADTIYQSVNITSSISYYNIGGNILQSGSPACAHIYLINQDTAGHLVLSDSLATVDSIGLPCVGAYSFNGVPVDTYYVKAAPTSSDPDSANYLPTYYGDVLHWSDATPVDITGNVSGIDIHLIAGSNPGGPGFVSGWVSQGAGLVLPNQGSNLTRGAASNLAHAQVNLLTSTNTPVAYTYSDASGGFSFSNLALGSYKIYAEILNAPEAPDTFTLSAQNPTDTGVAVIATGIGQLNDLRVTGVYPNPVSSKLQIEISSGQSANATLCLWDILGREVTEQKLNLVSGMNRTEIDMAQLAAGVYDLTLLSDNGKTTFKVIKAK